jgi:hypothetical protein
MPPAVCYDRLAGLQGQRIHDRRQRSIVVTPAAQHARQRVVLFAVEVPSSLDACYTVSTMLPQQQQLKPLGW